MLEQSFINYLTNFAKNAPDSCPVPWYDNYFKSSNDKTSYKVDDFKKIKNRVVANNDSENDFNNVWCTLEHTLTRNDLFQYFKAGSDESLYKGYVATMLWGGIGLGGGSKTNLENAMSQPKSEILDRIKKIIEVLGSGKENEVKAAFIMMTKEYGTKFKFNGKDIPGAKIPGIDISYFTKLLFFLGNKDWDYQPLVYDNQLQNVHCALLKDDGKGLQSLFDVHSFKMDSSSISLRISLKNKDFAKPVDFYMDFIKRVKSLSKSMELSGDDEFQGKAGRLEEIMFGKELKKSEKDPQNNPRAFVKNYLGLYDSENVRNSNNANTAGDVREVDTLISELKEKYPDYHFAPGTILPNKSKIPIVSCELADNIFLEIGEKTRNIYCGIYAKSPDTILPYEMLFDNHTDSKSYKGQYNNYQKDQVDQAIKQFSAILDLEIAKKSNQ